MLRRLYWWIRGWRRYRIAVRGTDDYLYLVVKDRNIRPTRIYYTTADGETISKAL